MWDNPQWVVKLKERSHTEDEITGQHGLFDTKQVDRTIIETYLFFVLDLSKDHYSRTTLSQITREINKVFPIPVMGLFQYEVILKLVEIVSGGSYCGIIHSGILNLKKGATPMRKDTLLRKQVTRGFRDLPKEVGVRDRMFQILVSGKTAFDETMLDIGRMFAEAIMSMDREEMTGLEYAPIDPALKKWASQQGSVYLGDQKVRVFHPRVRDVVQGREVPLRSYEKLKEKGVFSEELWERSSIFTVTASLMKSNSRRYKETRRL